MSTRMTKQTLVALDRTEFVVTSIRTQRAMVTSELAEVFGSSPPEGGQLPDWDALQESHAMRLEQSATTIRQTEQGHRQNQARMAAERKQRRQIIVELRSNYRSLRNSVEGNYPSEALTILGLEEQPTRRYFAVREQMPEVLARLRSPEVAEQMPPPLPGHSALDFEHFAAPMEASIQALEVSQEAIRENQKILDESLLAKREALKENRRVYLNLARIQEGYYRLAGLDELADRIRTEVFRISRSRKTEPAEESNQDSSETPPTEAASEASRNLATTLESEASDSSAESVEAASEPDA